MRTIRESAARIIYRPLRGVEQTAPSAPSARWLSARTPRLTKAGNNREAPKRNLGRTFDEYCAYFQLEDGVLRSGRILDLGAGISSFCAEATARGYDVTAADPIYGSSSEDIAEKSQADLADVLLQLPGAAHKYNWTYPDCSALTFDVRKSNFEFLKNSNELLIIPSAEHQATP